MPRTMRSNDANKFKSTRPVLFEYAHTQKPENFDRVFYDYVEDVSKIEGKSVVERSQIDISCLTKTKVQRESDDASNENKMIATIKTNTQREADDSPCELVNATTKTFVNRETDENINPYVLLLTKTESSREADE